MRVMRFRGENGTPSVGVAVADGERLLDLAAAQQARTGRAGQAGSDPMIALIESGREGLDEASRTVEWAVENDDPRWFRGPEAVEWLTPVPARFCLGAGRNFRAHLEESKPKNPAEYHFDFPTGFAKLPQSIVPHRAQVRRPEDVIQFDYEVELTVVIGAAAERVSTEAAMQHVFGYTIMNDLSAREWQAKEMQNRLLLVGKNFPGSGPLGPYILTADEVPDPASFELSLSVNGDLRQKSTCEKMIFSVAELVAFWSRMGLAPGDLISTGTPEGVAHFHPDRPNAYLKPGDVVEASVVGIGTLETRIT